MDSELTTESPKVKRVGGVAFPERKVWVKTFGCQMNYHDSERLLSNLKDLNYTQTENKAEADLVLFNTCAVRDLANEKFYSQLGEIKALKKENPDLVVGVGGCVSQTDGKELIKKYKHLNFAFGTDVVDQIGDMVYRTYAGEDKFAVNTWDRTSDYSIETKINHGTPQAFVNVIKGCDKFCSYCIVPFTRGRERSRKIAEVVKDVSRLVKYQGIQEVMLLGQNVNSFGKDNGETLAQLIYELDAIEGLELIRYTTSHPYDMTDDLILAHGKVAKLSKHLHLPVQSGSNTVLQRMLREYTADHYLSILKKLRASTPEIVISTDIIVGFPNETDEEYQDTLKLLDNAQFDFIYSYAFSPRAKTKAARMSDFLTDDIRGERLRYLQKYQLAIQAKIRKEMEGKVFRILIDKTNDMKGVKKWQGRTNCGRIVHFIPQTLEQDFQWHWADVLVTAATALSCQGELVRDLGRRLEKTSVLQ